MSEAPLTWSSWLEDNQSAGLVGIPDALGRSPWRPSEADRRAAWVLLTEIRTRVATQGLQYRSGDEGAALDSLYQLFAITRDAIKEGGPDCGHFATVATLVLDTHVRPLTAKWHKKKIEGRLLNDDDRREFRRELDAVRGKLVVLCRLLGRMSVREGGFLDDVTCVPVDPDGGSGSLGPGIPFDGVALPQGLFDAELKAIRARRGQDGAVENLCGLVCSGGGIRSATISLGIVQAIARRGILPDVDYLSTVSGGGYFGSFLSSYLNDNDHGSVGLEPGQLPFSEPGRVEPAPIRRLRNNSKYLLKGGLLGQARMAGLLLYGILVNFLALLPVLLGFLIVSQLVGYLDISDQGVQQGVNTFIYGLLVLLASMVFGLPFSHLGWASNRKRVALYERCAVAVGILAIAVWVLGSLMPALYDGVRGLDYPPQLVIAGFLALPALFAGSAFALGWDRLSGRILIALSGIAGPFLLVMAFFALDDWLDCDWPTIAALGLSLLLLLVWLRLINLNRISPHKYYRNRLAETYLLRRRANDAVAVDPQPLSRLRSSNPRAPYHLINAAVNLPGSKAAELRGRYADFFLMSQDFCGSPLLGYCATAAMEKKDSYLDLGTAMSISGAAASSFMGTKTVKGVVFWLSLLNIRLAYWLPNPRHIEKIPDGAGMGPLSLWRELFGGFDEEDRFVNLSDGGHIENLGIYELLRRRCKFIIALDGEADFNMRFPSLMQLIRFAQIDLGIRIRIDLDDLTTNEAGYSRAHFVLGKIEYGSGQTGFLLYIKSSLTGNERDYVLDYRRKSPTFPHETTADQFFSEAQFEAYRALGEHIGDDLFGPEFIDTDNGLSLDSWFSRLARNLV